MRIETYKPRLLPIVFEWLVCKCSCVINPHKAKFGVTQFVNREKRVEIQVAAEASSFYLASLFATTRNGNRRHGDPAVMLGGLLCVERRCPRSVS